MDAAPQTVVVSENDTQTLTFTNTKKQELVIRKIDEDTRQPLKNALFSIAKANGEVINGRAETDINGLITINDLEPDAYIVSEIKAPDGYVLQEAPMTVEVKTGFPTEVTFTNRQAYGIQIRKIAKGEFIGAYTTDSAGLANVPNLEDDVYTVQEVSAPEGYRINREPQNVIVKAGVLATATFENERLAGIRIKKIDAVTKEGIYGVRFLVKDEGNRVVGEYTTDQDGYIDLDELETNGESVVTFKVEEIAAAEGYILDKKVKTLKVNRGETTELVIENTPILGQIQVCKKAPQENIVTNQTKGTPLAGAVFEVTNADTGRVVDTITSDARGIAATNPIPLGRYFVQEVKAPACYQLNSQKVEVKLKVEGDVVQIEVYDDAANLKTTIQKTSNQTVDAGANMRYDISGVANESNVALDNFFWHDRIPTDAVRVGSITTGKYSGRAWYKIKFKTNKRDYRTLTAHLLFTSSYAFKIDSASLKLATDEYVTDIRYEFGAVPVGFKMAEKATLLVYVPASVGNGYQIINRADVGGSYNGEWDGATAV